MSASVQATQDQGRGGQHNSIVCTAVFIVTPVKLYRDGIAHYLSASDDIEVLGTAAESSAATIGTALELRPDVILLDMALEGTRDTARALSTALPQAAIVALAVPESEGHLLGCAEAGICGYVSREGSLEELRQTVIRAANAEAICSPRIAASLFRRVAALASPENRLFTADGAPALTARQTEILALIDDGLSNKQIARRLCIEVPTVKNHVHSILAKLGASSRSEAAARARRLGLHVPREGSAPGR